MEPSFYLAECFSSNGDCVISPACELQSILGLALKAFMKSISQYTLADITKKPIAIRDLLMTG
jgi:Rrf2 family nitric oxide-sensitive transcriptional repressor